MELGVLVLRGSRRAEHLGRGGLVEAAVQAGRPDGLEQAQGADGVGRRGVVGHLEGHLDVAHRAEVVDLVGLDAAHEVDQADTVGEVAVVQVEALVLVQVVDAGPGQHRGASYEAVDVVPLAKEELGQVRPVLSGDAGDERCFHSRSLTCPHCEQVARIVRRTFRHRRSAAYAGPHEFDHADPSPRSGQLPRALVAVSNVLTGRVGTTSP